MRYLNEFFYSDGFSGYDEIPPDAEAVRGVVIELINTYLEYVESPWRAFPLDVEDDTDDDTDDEYVNPVQIGIFPSGYDPEGDDVVSPEDIESLPEIGETLAVLDDVDTDRVIEVRTNVIASELDRLKAALVED